MNRISLSPALRSLALAGAAALSLSACMTADEKALMQTSRDWASS